MRKRNTTRNAHSNQLLLFKSSRALEPAIEVHRLHYCVLLPPRNAKRLVNGWNSTITRKTSVCTDKYENVWHTKGQARLLWLALLLRTMRPAGRSRQDIHRKISALLISVADARTHEDASICQTRSAAICQIMLPTDETIQQTNERYE